MRRPGARDCGQGQGGTVALEWALGVALLLLPMLALVAVLPSWSATRAMGVTAAREAARAAAAIEDATAARAAAVAAASEVAVNHGLAGRLGDVTLELPDVDADGRLDRGGVVRSSVTVMVPAVSLPVFGEVADMAVTVGHAEPLAPLRSRDGP